MHSCLYEGEVRHRRFSPRPHSFNVRFFLTYLDLDELGLIFQDRWLWSTQRPAVAWFRRSDYFGDRKVSLKTAVYDRVEEETGERPTGPVRVLTHLRYWGYVFNPVSFYFCFDETDSYVKTIMADITNTPWGEHHAYVLPREKSLSESDELHFQIGKTFHISPFMPMDMEYGWSFSPPGEQLKVQMENLKNGQRVFDAIMQLTRLPINATNCGKALVKYPLMTLQVISTIYYQALRLFLKRTPFYSHPDKLDVLTRGGAESAKLS